jgi:sn-glycerol 3-phosphate transport system permease protein
MSALRPTYRPPGERASLGALLVLAAGAFLFVYPFLWMTLSAFKSNMEIFRPRQLWPESWNGEFFVQLWRGDWFPFGSAFLNSLLAAAGQAAGAVLLTSMAGYVFGRHEFRGRRWWFMLSLVVIVIPPQVLAIPLFLWVNRLGLMDSLWGVVLPGTVSGLGILYFTQVFRQMPRELIESARMEGASEFRVYRTLLPLIRSALLSFGLIQFILAWHQHLIPLLILNSPDKQTLPLALAGLYGSSLRFPYAVLMAGSTMTVLPTMVLFAVLYRRFKSSLADLLVH